MSRYFHITGTVPAGQTRSTLIPFDRLIRIRIDDTVKFFFDGRDQLIEYIADRIEVDDNRPIVLVPELSGVSKIMPN